MTKTEVPLDCDDPANQDLLLQQYGERIEKLSQQNKVSKFCMDAGFLSVVENGQYFMTKDNGEQFYAMACRPVTCTVNMELRSELWSLNKDNSHSWVRISHGSDKFVTNLNNNEQEMSEVQLEDYALKLNASDFACRSKAKAKPQRKEPADSSSRTIPMNRRHWIDIEPGKHSLCIRNFEESNSSSSSFSASTSRRGWSGSFLENERKSSEPIPAVYSLV